LIKYFDISPIERLKGSDIPLWGKMTPQHMVEHLCLAFKTSNGKIHISDFIIPAEKLEISKRILMSNRPLPKNFVNTIIGGGLTPLINESLSLAVNELIEEIENFVKYFESNPAAKPVNATFGPLNKAEWIHFHKKHLKHHFEQFGLLDIQK